MLASQVRGIYSREVNKIVFCDGSTKFFNMVEADCVDDGELAEFVTHWALTNKHIMAGESIAVI